MDLYDPLALREFTAAWDLKHSNSFAGKEGSRWGYQTSRLRNDGPTGVAKVRFVTNTPPPTPYCTTYNCTIG